MNKSDVTKFLKTAQRFVSKRSPEILTGVGIVGMCTTVVLAVKATPKALELIEEAEEIGRYELEKSGNYDDEHITDLQKEIRKPLNVIKVVWKPYIPAVLTGAASIACIIGASSVNARRNAALYSAYKLSETALTEFKDKAVEVVGEERVKDIKQKIAEDKVEKIAPKKEDDDNEKAKVIITDDGDTWFIDPFSNTPFRSNKNKIDAAAIRVSRNFVDDIFVSLSDFYDELDLPHTATSDDLGWSADDVRLIEVDYSDAIVRDGKAYVVMDFLVRPHYGYNDKNKYYG